MRNQRPVRLHDRQRAAFRRPLRPAARWRIRSRMRRRVAGAGAGGPAWVLSSPPLGRACADVFRAHGGGGFVAKVSATAFESFRRETAIWSAEAAAASGADGVAVMMQLIPENEEAVIRLAATFGEECERLGLPYVVEAELPGAYQEN